MLQYKIPEYVPSIPARNKNISWSNDDSMTGTFVFCEFSDISSSNLYALTKRIDFPLRSGVTSGIYNFVVPSASPSANCPLTFDYVSSSAKMIVDESAHTL